MYTQIVQTLYSRVSTFYKIKYMDFPHVCFLPPAFPVPPPLLPPPLCCQNSRIITSAKISNIVQPWQSGAASALHPGTQITTEYWTYLE